MVRIVEQQLEPAAGGPPLADAAYQVVIVPLVDNSQVYPIQGRIQIKVIQFILNTAQWRIGLVEVPYWPITIFSHQVLAAP
jgi:hypothetical protein